MSRNLMDVSLEDLLDDLDETEGPLPDDGWLSTEEWSQKWSCGLKKAERSIRKLCRHGRMEATTRTGYNVLGHAYRLPVYKLVDNAP